MSGLWLKLLGGFELRLASGAAVPFSAKKPALLLAYLALRPGQPQGRDKLAGLFWGDSGEAQARASLRQALTVLRRRLGPHEGLILAPEGETLALSASGIATDVATFERGRASGTRDALERAVALYAGDLLDGFQAREPLLEEWLVAERQRLREQALAAMTALLPELVAADPPDAGVRLALRILALDPLQEAAHRALMRLHVRQGRRGAALARYQTLREALAREFGASPEEETQRLYKELRDQRGAPENRAATAARVGNLPAGAAVVEEGPPVEAPARKRVEMAETGPVWVARGFQPGAEGKAFANLSAPGPGGVGPPSEPESRSPTPLLARDPELRQLRQSLTEALRATRQVVFVTGEPGIGKTALAAAFAGCVAHADPTVRIGCGQCLEHRGPGEAYLPILEAVSRLCREPGSGDEVIRTLDRHAPTWLAQMPGLLEPAALETLERRNRSATRERMLREMAEALEVLSARRPLLLVLEDLQWSDASTIDLLAWLARRREPARLMVVGTCRPTETKPGGNPLHATVRELCRQDKARELALGFLDEAAAADYLKSRLGDALVPDWLPRLLHERTEGNPLFMGNLVESWIAQGLLAETAGSWSLPATPDMLAADVPSSLRQLVEQQLDQLAAEDRAVLEEASVVGRVFSPALTAAAGERDAEETERRCAKLARDGCFIAPRGVAEWPDGTIASRYGFIHDLYQEVLCDRVPAGGRARLHRRYGLCLERSYGPRAHERAAELASHLLRGRDFGRALSYLQLAAQQAFQRSAHPEAIVHLDLAFDALRYLAEDKERSRVELALQTMRGEILTVTEGWSSRAAEGAFLRARELCRHVPGEPPELSRVLYGLSNLYEFRGEFATSADLIGQCLTLLAAQDEASFLQAQELLTCSLYHRGEFVRSLSEATSGLARYQSKPSDDAPIAGEMAVHLHAWAAMALWFLGRPDQALARARDLVEFARRLDSPAATAAAFAKGAIVHQLRGDAVMTEAWAARALELATVYGFRYRAATASVLRGWALAGRGWTENGVALLREGLAACRETGAEMDRPYYLALLAEACRSAGRNEEGLRAATEGLFILSEARSGQPFFYEAELLRLKSCLLLDQGGCETEAEALLRQAQDVARRQRSSSLELRSALALARLHPNRRGAHAVSEIYPRFKEGFDTPDLVEAKELLGL